MDTRFWNIVFPFEMNRRKTSSLVRSGVLTSDPPNIRPSDLDDVRNLSRVSPYELKRIDSEYFTDE